jgi:hypothetical protein
VAVGLGKEWRPQTTTTEILSFAQNDEPRV